MKTKPLPQAILDDAHVICAKIKEEAAYQIAEVNSRAKAEAEHILAQAKAQAQRKSDEMLKDMERQIARVREKIASTLSLERKKIILDEKNKSAQFVIAAVRHEAGEFRNTKDYASFMKRAILEGARVIDTETIDVLHSSLDTKLISDDFIKETSAFVVNTLKKNFVFNFTAADFSDIGVIMQSHDGRLMYDNRFAGRLERVQEEVVARLLREAA